MNTKFLKKKVEFFLFLINVQKVLLNFSVFFSKINNYEQKLSKFSEKQRIVFHVHSKKHFFENITI